MRKGEGIWINNDGDTKYTKFKHFMLNFQGTVNWCYKKLRYSCYRKQSFYAGVNRKVLFRCDNVTE